MDAMTDDVPLQFIGVWKLVSFERRQVGVETVVKTYGEHPKGYRIHTTGHRMIYMFFAEDRKASVGAVTDADRIAWSKTMASAAGPFESIGGNKVVFYPEVSAVQYLQPITFGFEIEGNDLTMTSDPMKDPTGGPDIYFRSTYVRAE
ncbi:lipocalin-like domain-containing protein [Bradyrhizobium sp. 26S5]|uniref:lipocalin-like domain-containing protein n=1 Tax=Bradyrhizobium sp. 26S5 TaxID=3139729 RepID=UPI0030CF9988